MTDVLEAPGGTEQPVIASDGNQAMVRKKAAQKSENNTAASHRTRRNKGDTTQSSNSKNASPRVTADRQRRRQAPRGVKKPSKTSGTPAANGGNQAVVRKKAPRKSRNNRPASRRTRRRKSQREPLIVFIHVPKTAGTTVREFLRTNYPPNEVRSFGNVFKGSGGADAGRIRKLPEALERISQEAQVIHGHIPVGLRRYLPEDARFVTLLRDPVERTLSQYYTLPPVGKSRTSPPPSVNLAEDAFADGGGVVDNLQTRMLSDVVDPASPATEEMLEQAKQNVRDRFFAFGLLERFDESLALIARRLGLDEIGYVPQRVSVRPRANEVPADIRSSAKRVNHFDIQLYRWAARQFDQVVQGEGIALQLAVARLRLLNLEGLLGEANGIRQTLAEQLRLLEPTRD